MAHSIAQCEGGEVERKTKERERVRKRARNETKEAQKE
jgi:hypothetical protein